MYRFRLIAYDTGADLGPLLSQRLVFAPGELIARQHGERFEVVRTVEPENESFRAYLVVRPIGVDSRVRFTDSSTASTQPRPSFEAHRRGASVRP